MSFCHINLNFKLFFLGGTAQIAGVHTAVIKNNEDGTFNLDDLRKKIRRNPDFHEPISSLVVVENTHNLCGGKVSVAFQASDSCHFSEPL